MVFLHLYNLVLLSATAFSAFAQEDISPGDAANTVKSTNLAVKVSASFPSSEIFGIKLVNGHPTQALLSFTNDEPTPVNIAFVGGSLWAPDPATKGATSRIVRNVTSTRYNVQIPAGEKESVSYSFATELHPQDLRLQLAVVLTNELGTTFTLSAFNETVSVVEPDASLFDLQLIFLYLFLLAIFLGTLYFVYNTWITTLFPQKARGGKGGERAKRSSGGSKKVDPADQTAVLGADGPAVTSGAKAYDESWIPAAHLQRPEARRVKSGARPKSRGKAE
ncbi:hypothetical protein MMC19_006584 [Ptychographa xylographoides]|nr:hypothetical protein [Ptychographa xylographoides]